MKLFLILTLSITSLNPTSTNTHLEQKIAIVESDTTDGNYIKFTDDTGEMLDLIPFKNYF